eukprot:gene36231-48788_t
MAAPLTPEPAARASGVETAKLGDTSNKVGLLPDEGGAWLFPRLMGLDRALKMTLLSEIYDAATAAGLGLVTEVVRRRLFPALLRSRRVPGRLLGEDVATAVDQVGALTAYLGRFEPLRRAAVVSPLLIAAMVMLASPVSAAILIATLLPFGIGSDDYKRLFCKDDEAIFDSFIPLTARGQIGALALSSIASAKRLVKQNPTLMQVVQKLRSLRGH